MSGECQALLHGLFLQAQYSDMWQWQRDPDRGYSVRSAYQLLTSQQPVTLDEAEDLVLAQTGSLEGVYFFPETLARHVTNKRKSGKSRHHHSRSSLLCVRLRRC
ncbi:hypothetical protein A2U01_0011585 [Trifolium medium]|uniref:Uncharacterized protein n=1 Tax=Trifolium medium TaxID=97028 RepID=A0A392MTL7_9FABA|nr:hypothetical protein [Trifolium medium]